MIERLVQFTLNARSLVLFVGVLVIVAGIFSYGQLPVDAFPDVSPNVVQVFTSTDGLAPEEIAKYVTYPVDGAWTPIQRQLYDTVLRAEQEAIAACVSGARFGSQLDHDASVVRRRAAGTVGNTRRLRCGRDHSDRVSPGQVWTRDA